jgi:hypothetical protein
MTRNVVGSVFWKEVMLYGDAIGCNRMHDNAMTRNIGDDAANNRYAKYIIGLYHYIDFVRINSELTKSKCPTILLFEERMTERTI